MLNYNAKPHKSQSNHAYAREYFELLMTQEHVDPPEQAWLNGYADILFELYETHVEDGPEGVNVVVEALVPTDSQLAALVDLSSNPISLLHADELDNLPPLTWLIDGEIPNGGLTVLYGASGSGKSFVALDYALQVAQTSQTVYIAAEGESGYAARKNAWCQYHGKTSGKLYFITEGIPLLDADNVSRLIDAVSQLKPALIVVDTLARCMLGGDENSARDMGAFIAACDTIRHETGAAVLVVHHTGKSGGSERGSSALRGACDSMISLTNKDEVLKLESTKSKDSAGFPDRYLQLHEVTLEDGAVSCVVTKTSKRGNRNSTELTKSQLKLLETLSMETFKHAGAKSSVLIKLTEISASTVYGALSTLLEKKYIRQAQKGDPYFLAQKGEDYLAKLDDDDDSGQIQSDSE